MGLQKTEIEKHLEDLAIENGYDDRFVMLGIQKDTLYYDLLLVAIERYGDERYSDGQDNSGDGRSYHYGGM